MDNIFSESKNILSSLFNRLIEYHEKAKKIPPMLAYIGLDADYQIVKAFSSLRVPIEVIREQLFHLALQTYIGLVDKKKVTIPIAISISALADLTMLESNEERTVLIQIAAIYDWRKDTIRRVLFLYFVDTRETRIFEETEKVLLLGNIDPKPALKQLQKVVIEGIERVIRNREGNNE